MLHWNKIIEGCKQQNPQSQEELYRGCYAGMMKLCIRYARDLDEAAAIYNEAMLKVFKTLQQFEGRGDFMGWVRRIVVNTCIDHCRRQAKFTHCLIDQVEDATVSLEPDIYNRLSANDVINLLQELPRNTALVFNLFVLDGYKHEEIGLAAKLTTTSNGKQLVTGGMVHITAQQDGENLAIDPYRTIKRQ